MVLSVIEFMQGFFSLLFVVISVLVGLRLIFKYFEVKKRVFLLVGLAWIGFSNPWIPDSINFVLILSFNITLNEVAYLIIGNVFLPFFLIVWLIAFTDLLYKDRQKQILLISVILTVIFEISFFALLAVNVNLIGKSLGPFHYEFSPFIEVYLIICILVVLITGLLFSRESFRSSIPELRLKGILLMIAFVSFAIGSILDSTIPLTAITVLITRIILISGAVEFYGGLILPNWMKKLFLKGKQPVNPQ